ncbi:MAG: hypothetical protein SO067_06925 [Bacilli bacterium]|jgi:hypothetical protein|nr:hypothetical protein [Clostridium sp.]MDY3798828.1 hypothetical protein [Bacilli bacterium]CDE95553.1 peptidase S26B signal peptidase [Clostridium sp. CAG:914]
MKKVARTILICIYFIITILITYCLLSYNKYNVSEFKDKYLLVLKENNKYYHKSDLLIIKKTNNYQEGDTIFYYDGYNSSAKVKISKIKNIELVKEDYSLYTLENDLTINADSILGTTKNTTSYSILGSIYSIVTSKWGYLIIIIMPMLAAFICEIYQIIKEVKR